MYNHSVKWREAAKTFAVVHSLMDIAAKKSHKYGDSRSFQLLFLFYQQTNSNTASTKAIEKFDWLIVVGVISSPSPNPLLPFPTTFAIVSEI